MRDEISKELVNFYKTEMNLILLVELDGRGLVGHQKMRHGRKLMKCI